MSHNSNGRTDPRSASSGQQPALPAAVRDSLLKVQHCSAPVPRQSKANIPVSILQLATKPVKQSSTIDYRLQDPVVCCFLHCLAQKLREYLLFKPRPALYFPKLARTTLHFLHSVANKVIKLRSLQFAPHQAKQI